MVKYTYSFRDSSYDHRLDRRPVRRNGLMVYENEIGTGVSNHVKIETNLWGRDLDITIYCYHFTQGTIITFGVEPRGDGITFIRDGHGTQFRYVEQEIVLRPNCGVILNLSELAGGEVAAGRTVAKALLDVSESLFEYIRLSILNNIGNGIKGQFASEIKRNFGKSTSQTIKSMLSQINWPALLNGSGATEQCTMVVCGSLVNNAPRQFPFDFTGVTGIKELPPPLKYDCKSLADMKATMLLKLVCGEKLYNMFVEHGYIEFHNNGYWFKMYPGKWIQCTDPNGRSAELCIHTANFNTNWIDELPIAYLNIRDDMFAFLRLANVFNAQQGFCRDGIMEDQGVAA